MTPFAAVRSRPDLDVAAEARGLPAVLKTADWGYDGKGQRLVRSSADIAAAWPQFDGRDAIFESFIDFECEVSVIVARDDAGRTRLVIVPVAKDIPRGTLLGNPGAGWIVQTGSPGFLIKSS